MKTSFLELIENDTKIIGTKGTMIVSSGFHFYTNQNAHFKYQMCFCTQVPDFSCPTSVIDMDGTEKTWPLPKAKYEFNFPINTCGLRYEADEVRNCIRAGKLERDTISHKDSIKLRTFKRKFVNKLALNIQPTMSTK